MYENQGPSQAASRGSSHVQPRRGLVIVILSTVLPWLLIAWPLPALAADSLGDLVHAAHRIVMLGDSITAAGPYVAYFDAWLLTQPPGQRPAVIDAGLPSETVSGLSEEGHAGGAFPRPDLAERLDRVLALTKPDLVIACYGMNCGIYEPWDPDRFARYQHGITHLHDKVTQAGAQLILITPPFYDDHRAPRSGFSYNEVLGRYSDWLLSQRQMGWHVVDLHGPMTRTVLDARIAHPDFTFQPDGVHPNNEGHWFVAQQLIRACGDETVAQAKTPSDLLTARQLPAAILPIVEQRVALLRDAYVGKAGHKRPGIGPGLPLDEAETKADELTKQIEAIIRGK